MADKPNSFRPKNRQEWRKWLQINHTKKENTWVVFYHKRSGIPTISYDEAVEEALCFGWIDSKSNKRDEQSSYRYFAKRNPKSAWSRINKERAEKLFRLNLITPQGRAIIEAAMASGAWNALDSAENLEIPPDLKRIFSKNSRAGKCFNSFPPGVRKRILSWINNAKLPATRKKRIEETVTLAAANKRVRQ